MRKRNSPAKNTTRKNAKTEKPETKAELVDRTMEKAVLEVWTNTGVHSLANKRAKPVDNEILEIAPEVLHDSVETETYILREMPTSVQVLTRRTVCRKICQDIFLKAALMQGHRAIYVPAWETYPLWIEEAVIEAANPKVPLKLSVLRKRCRARHREALEVQKQILHQLGIFADWGAAQKTVEPRQEARLVTLIRDRKSVV